MSDLLVCSECEKQYSVGFGDALPKFGFYFTPREFGYYSGFSDNFPWGETKEEDNVFFCHDCCIRLLESFPSIARAIGEGGHHPCGDDVPCCKYAWQGTDLFGKNHDEFLVRTRHPVVDDKTGKLRWEDDEPQDGMGRTTDTI